MDAENLARLIALFDAAVELDPSARGAWLDRECAGDPALRQQVERLLQADAATGSREGIPAAIRSATRDLTAAEQRTGTRAGPYVLGRLLGQGGMGAVYLADRADAEYQAQVAIKLVAHSGRAEDLVRRFRAERQILASLEHPHIARLLDGGTLEDGTPYLVMEHVNGVPVNQYCDSVQASLHKRIELFLAICDAVAHAHRRLVVHRDLKPGNILVTPDGVPKLLDFGIAKLLSPEQVGTDLQTTGDAGRMMTPAYASPEQVRGGPITTATDVYALGLLLYELLTGRAAHRFDSGSPSSPRDIEEVITAQLPERPSDSIHAESAVEVARARAMRPDRLRRALRGDLDTIVMMALRKEPERRYASVELLAADLRAHLERKPVLARPDSWGYRTGRFVARHRTAMAGTTAAVLLLSGFAVTTAIQSRRIDQERQTAQQVSAFLVDIFRGADPWETPRSDISARELAARGAARVEADLGGQPAVQATLFHALGRIYERLALTDSALALTERAIAVRRSLGNAKADLAASMALRAELLLQGGRASDAAEAHQETLALKREVFGPEHAEVAYTLQHLGSALFPAGRRDEGTATLRDALAMFQRTAGPDDARTLRSQVVLAGALHFLEQRVEAESLLVVALEGQRRTIGPDHPEILQTLNTLGVVRDYLDQTEASAAALKEAIAMGERHLGADHPDVLNAVGNLAALHGRLGPMPLADSMYRELIGRRRAAGRDWAVQASNHALVLLELGRAEEAERQLLEAVGDMDTRVATRGGTFTYLLNRLGGIRAARGDLAGSEAAYREAVEIGRRVYGPEAPRTGLLVRTLAQALDRRGRAAEAHAAFAEALAIRVKARPEDHPERIESLLDLAGSHQRAGRHAAAEPLLREALDIVGRAVPPDSTRLLQVRQQVVELYLAWGRPAQAAEFQPR